MATGRSPHVPCAGGTRPGPPARPLLRARAPAAFVLGRRWERSGEKNNREEEKGRSESKKRLGRRRRRPVLAAPAGVWGGRGTPVVYPPHGLLGAHPEVRRHGQSHLPVLPGGGGEGPARQGRVSGSEWGLTPPISPGPSPWEMWRGGGRAGSPGCCALPAVFGVPACTHAGRDPVLQMGEIWG